MVVNAFVDTGNGLYEPFSGRPVCLVDYESARRTLSPELMSCRPIPIPYKTIDKNTGILWGIAADKVIFQNSLRKVIKSGCVIAFIDKNNNQSGGYKAIVHPDVLEK